MSRQARTAAEYQHLIVRGIGRQILFESPEDYRTYLAFLRRFSSETQVNILAYCLMENHVHLLVQDKGNTVPLFMKKMGIAYAGYFNRKYERCGHLFQDRYKSEIIEDNRYLLTVYRYILNNPEKAGICSAPDYPWSSFRDFYSGGITSPGLFRELIGDSAAFVSFMALPDEETPMETDPTETGDDRALAILRRELNVSSGTQLQRYARPERDAALALLKSKGLSIRQLERLTGINRGVIQRAK